MKTLKIVSWNLRTFGDPIPPDVALRRIAEIIVNVLGADIVCLQEIQAGTEVTTTIGCPVTPAIVNALGDLLGKLRALEPNAGWQFVLSGVNNSAKAKSMRDAYAFFWKARPSASGLSHPNAPLQIALLQGPTILRQPGGDLFPGRRPGMAVFEITSDSSQPPVPLNIISWHAATPCNTIGKAKNGASSGRALFALATLTEIGGIMRKGTLGGRGYEWEEMEPLPDVDTIFLGDCNYSMGASSAEDVYHNLTTNYEPCVSTFDNIINTTYSADPSKPFSSVSSYDNIFVLRRTADFVPAVTFNGTSGAYDFIAADARALGGVSGIKFFANEAAWYVCYLDAYKRQLAYTGISDHLPVWSEFEVEDQASINARIQPTSGADNNCLFHATFGTPDMDDTYIDDGATDRRTWFANQAEQAIASPNFDLIRHNVLGAMINEFQGNPAYLGVAQNLLANPQVNAAMVLEWPAMVTAYLQGIRGGRMLWADEAAMLAVFANITIRLWFVRDGTYQSQTLNAGHAQTDIYHFGLHFFRFEPN